MKKYFPRHMVRALPLVCAALIAMRAPQAFALCESPISGTQSLENLANTDTDNLSDYLNQELDFIDNDLEQTATTEVTDRFDEFNDNILAWLNDWWPNRLLPAMKDMTKQIAAAKIDQTRQLGSMQDVTMLNESIAQGNKQQLESIRRAAISENTCQIDTAGIGQTKGYRMSRAIARGYAQDAGRDMGNDKDSPGGGGQGASKKMAVMYDDYTNLYCDPARGDQGCTAAGSMAGLNNDLGAFLWGEKQTLDMSQPQNVKASKAVIANIAGPFVANVVPASAAESAQGHEELLQRRAKRARQNTVNNALGQMMGMTAGGTGVDTHEMRTAAGTQAADASTDASYREIMQATTRERFSDPDYIFRMVNYPAATVREHGAVNAIRLQQLSEIYKRTEEMVWVESALLGDMLDTRVPYTALSSRPLRP